MNQGPRRTWAVPALVVGGIAILALVTVFRRASQPTPPPPPAPVAAVAPSAPREPAPVSTTTAAPSPIAPPAGAPRSHSAGEAELMSRLREIKQSDPAGAIRLARAGNQRFPDTQQAAERASILIHALAETGASSEARGEAEDMVNRYADDHWVREIEAFTGAHRHRNLRLNDAGQVEAYDPPGVGPASRDR